MKTLRISQLNILHREIEDRYQLVSEAAEFNYTDVLCLQEVADMEDLKKRLSIAGLSHSIFGGNLSVAESFQSCSAIFSKFPIEQIDLDRFYYENQHSIPFDSTIMDGILAGIIKVEGKIVNVITAHMRWGGDKEEERLMQAWIINKIAEQLEQTYENSFTVLAGDLNAEPDSRTIRYLMGKDLSLHDDSTLWVDAYKMHGKEENYATNDHATNPYGITTAKGKGITLTEFLPARRIDYILVKNWIYGKVGCPVNFGYFNHPAKHILSDHNGIQSDLILDLESKDQ